MSEGKGTMDNLQQAKTRDEFFYRHSYIVLMGGPAIVFGTCLFWTIVNYMYADMYCLIKSGAEWFILLLMACSVVLVILNRKTYRKTTISNKEMSAWRTAIMLYFLILMVGIGVITGASAMQAMETGTEKGFLDISLVSGLMFAPVFAPMARKSDSIIIAVMMMGAMFIPFVMPGSESYSLLPQLVFSIAAIVAYFIVRQRIDRTYELENEIRDYSRTLEKSNEEVVDFIVSAVEIRDTKSGEHIKKVRGFTRILGEEIRSNYPEYNLDEKDIENMVKASSMHDIGKIMIDDSILLKPGKLTDEEFEIMKTHTRKGFDLLKRAPQALGEELIIYGKDICLYHHEKYDGKGYPFGLAGDEIPIWAQIVSVADCFEALTSDRCYKKAYAPERAYDMIMNGECGVFSDKILSCLEARKEDFIKLAKLN